MEIMCSTVSFMWQNVSGTYCFFKVTAEHLSPLFCFTPLTFLWLKAAEEDLLRICCLFQISLNLFQPLQRPGPQMTLGRSSKPYISSEINGVKNQDFDEHKATINEAYNVNECSFFVGKMQK